MTFYFYFSQYINFVYEVVYFLLRLIESPDQPLRLHLLAVERVKDEGDENKEF